MVLQAKPLVFNKVLAFAGMSIAYAVINTLEQHLRARVDAECRLVIRRMVIERVLYSEMGALQRRYFIAFNEEVRPDILENRMMQDISDTLNLVNFLIPNIIRGTYAFVQAARDVLKQDRLDILLLLRPTVIGILHELFVQIRQRFVSEPQLVALQTTEIAMNRVVGGIIEGLPDVQCNNMQEYQLKKLDKIIAQDVSTSQGVLTAATRIWTAISSRSIFDLISELYVTQYVMQARNISHEECRKASLDVTNATNLFRRLYDRLVAAYDILDAQHRVILLLSLPNFVREAEQLENHTLPFWQSSSSDTRKSSKSKLHEEDESAQVSISSIRNIVIGRATYRHATFVINAAAAAAVNELASNLIDQEILEGTCQVLATPAATPLRAASVPVSAGQPFQSNPNPNSNSNSSAVTSNDTSSNSQTISTADQPSVPAPANPEEKEIQESPRPAIPPAIIPLAPGQKPKPPLTIVPKLVRTLSDALQQSPLHKPPKDPEPEQEHEPPPRLDLDQPSNGPTFEECLNVVMENTALLHSRERVIMTSSASSSSNSQPADDRFTIEPLTNAPQDRAAGVDNSLVEKLSTASGSNARGIDGARNALDLRGMDDVQFPPSSSVCRLPQNPDEAAAWQTRSRIVLERGKMYALVGQNRSGKTTFVKMLCKLITAGEGQKWEDKEEHRLNMHETLWSSDESDYDDADEDDAAQSESKMVADPDQPHSIKKKKTPEVPYGGEVFVNDDIPLSSINRLNWRDFLSYVPQRPYLFQGTIEENIRCGNTEATTEEVLQAAIAAGLYFAETDNEEAIREVLIGASLEVQTQEQNQNNAGSENERSEEGYTQAELTAATTAAAKVILAGCDASKLSDTRPVVTASSAAPDMWYEPSPSSSDSGLVSVHKQDNALTSIPEDAGSTFVKGGTELLNLGGEQLNAINASLKSANTPTQAAINQAIRRLSLGSESLAADGRSQFRGNHVPVRPWERNRLFEITDFISQKVTGKRLQDLPIFSAWRNILSSPPTPEPVSTSSPVSPQTPQSVAKAASQLLLPALLQVELQPHGANVSGGTAQSIALARALLRKNAQLLILDESMSQMDGLKVDFVFPRLLEFVREHNITYVHCRSEIPGVMPLRVPYRLHAIAPHS